MSGIERGQAIAALMAAVTALFLLSRLAPAPRWRQQLRRTAVAAYAIAAAIALIWAILWLIGAVR